jgi:hypothetical protein
VPGHENHLLGEILERRAGLGQEAAHPAALLVLTLQEIDAALKPVIGERGVAALYKRSIRLTAAAHPWLIAAAEGTDTAVDYAGLTSALAQQPSASAAKGGSALLEAMDQVLGSLIGSALTERLLRSVGRPFTSDTTEQDISP